MDRSPTERRILDAAEAAFLDASRELVKVSDIAAAAGVSVGTVYLHFGSKLGLHAAVREDIQLELLEYTMAPIDDPAPPRWDDVMEHSRRWEQVFRGDLPRVRLIASLEFTFGADEHVAAVHQRMHARVAAALVDATARIERLVEAGELRPCDPGPTAVWIYGTILGTAVTLLHAPAGGVTPQAARDAFGRQRQMLAQALLPQERLTPDGLAPRDLWG